MPFAVFGLVLMPLQLDWVPLQIMGWGIFAVRHIAAFVAAWSPDGNPGTMPALTFVFWSIALVLAVVLSTRLKVLVSPFVVLGLMVFIRASFPVIVVSEDAKLGGVRLEDGRLAVNRKRPSQFTIDNWKTAYLVKEMIPRFRLKKKSWPRPMVLSVLRECARLPCVMVARLPIPHNRQCRKLPAISGMWSSWLFRARMQHVVAQRLPASVNAIWR